MRQDFIGNAGCFESFSPSAFLYYLQRLIDLTWNNAGDLAVVLDEVVQILSNMAIDPAESRAWLPRYDFTAEELAVVLEWLKRLEQNHQFNDESQSEIDLAKVNVETKLAFVSGLIG